MSCKPTRSIRRKAHRDARVKSYCYPFPEGPGIRSKDFDEDLKGEGRIRFYYITSVKRDESQSVIQCGCGLNLQDDQVATLCTCMHKMLRKIYKEIHEEKITPQYVGVLAFQATWKNGSSYAPLVFLGKIEASFSSFWELHNYLSREELKNAREKKDVTNNPVGDVYPPKVLRAWDKGNGNMVEVERLLDNHVHKNDDDYHKDMKESCPLVFTQWRAWPKGFDLGCDIVLKAPPKLLSFIGKGCHRNYRVFSLKELKGFLYSLRDEAR